MGYLVWPSGRLHLPESDDVAAAAAVKAAWAERGGWYTPDLYPPNDTVVGMAEAARASIIRDGDWIEFSRDDDGDPKWSHYATTFYVAIAPFVRSGTVQFEGEDGSRWSYTYSDGQMTQQGWNGWDGSVQPFGEYVNSPFQDHQ
ncbi:hypothetical protein ACWD6L_00510 [Micromonospora profundi]|uniref:Uncharacterized protein n=1 Tax=Micromonospora profundi TaxID=1420889 RepID=A0AAJ6HV84_9ACTN|nr:MULTISPECIES: hypothetical protein [Micromonospora]NJC15297.1 hypothetical protein [Micromonospora profundi]WLS46802.1 hypothetical protein Q3V37_05945 [Micromonospora profundi]